MLSFTVWAVLATQAGGAGLLDGKVFSGMIGPADGPDLADSLFFEDGYFWSDICTRCGFVPGEYVSEDTGAGIAFSGTLESPSRGRFAYRGLVQDDGAISVAIRWERRRWYWTSRREIAFVGHRAQTPSPGLSGIRSRIKDSDPDRNPACARF
ncbi:hypothetical protein [Marinovum sp.]|uniref:hypothetical protein n=1 Tax=Marinovum sp. TaxID=2024839 RepID=UPI003A92E78E